MTLNILSILAWQFDNASYASYFNTTATTLFAIGSIIVWVIILSTVYSYCRQIEMFKVSMIFLYIFIYFPLLKKKDYFIEETPEEILNKLYMTEGGTGYNEVLGIIGPI